MGWGEVWGGVGGGGGQQQNFPRMQRDITLKLKIVN